MLRRILVTSRVIGMIVLAACCVPAHAADDAKPAKPTNPAKPAERPAEDARPALVKQKAAEVGRAVIQNDFAKVADLTYPKIVEGMGGRERMIATSQEMMKQLKAKGMSFVSHKVGQPGELLTEGEYTFTVVPTVL